MHIHAQTIADQMTMRLSKHRGHDQHVAITTTITTSITTSTPRWDLGACGSGRRLGRAVLADCNLVVADSSFSPHRLDEEGREEWLPDIAVQTLGGKPVRHNRGLGFLRQHEETQGNARKQGNPRKHYGSHAVQRRCQLFFRSSLSSESPRKDPPLAPVC